MTNKEKLNEAIKEAKEKNSKELAFMKADLTERLRNIIPYLNEIADLVQEIGYRIEYYAGGDGISKTLIIKDNAIVFDNGHGDGFSYVPHDSFWFCTKERKKIFSLRKQYGIACEAELILKERRASIIEYIIQSAVGKEVKKDINVNSYYKINE
jgi:hypothetical protein